jgi:hypothetical protein
MAAEVSRADVLSDTLHTEVHWIGVRKDRGLSPKETEELYERMIVIGAQANDLASAQRLSAALERVGRTEHTTKLAKNYLRIAS